ncbi:MULTISPECIES: fimbria/pilus outer membrane usher protein [Serratia]|uniref:fimbria/pilus outer membrane usher protein n=1 Tax=Serratia TaxID=613 RepID=UPI000EF49EB1|nr:MULTISPECIES: fimbria/pilus outer membrane usher protein [Serratia]AYM93306.1 fimbrial biogenesis outer membrane usher protein [Serratia sp. 3ACOL1]MDK2376550.1 fimbria/pilus outer membrane usher protein [Serratia fonticola]
MRSLLIIIRDCLSVRKVNGSFWKVAITSAISLQSHNVIAQEVQDGSRSAKAVFDPGFLMQAAGNEVDVARFEYGNQLEPGEYRAETYLNEKFIGLESVPVILIEGKPKVLINKGLFNKIGIKSSALNTKAFNELNSSDDYYELGKLTTAAKVHFDSTEMRLDIQIPQADLLQTARGSVDPAMWDDGANALLLGYNTNYYESVANGKESQSFYGGTNVGYNLAGWMFRHSGSLTWQKNDRRDYNSIRNYVEHDITPLKARLTVGDAFTSGELFDTFGFRGVALNTIDKMLPDSQRGYAPVVRGVAQTNARVTIEQSGAVLYDTTVPPGAFVINDLYPTGYGGDLKVKVTEADGRQTTFSVPYASVPQLLRPGMTQYNAAIGTIRDLNISYTPRVAQVTLQHGLANSLTGYTGFLGTGDYSAGLVGAAIGTQFGALALDVTHARASAGGNTNQGSSYRATFSKMFAETGSSVSIAAYRFSSSGYLDLKNAMLFSDHYRYNNDDAALTLQRPRNRLSLTASQSFSEGLGQLYVSGFSQNYWNQSGNDKQYQIGYSNNFGRLSYSISANRLRNVGGDQETQYLVTFTAPLGSGGNSPNLNMNLGRTSNGLNSQASINGMLGSDDQFNYNLAAGRDENNNSAGSVSGVYRSPYSSLQGSYGQGKNYRSVSTGATGSVVVLSDSITASPYSSDTLAIISAPNAEGAKVEGYSGVIINNSGNALVPYLNSYRLNEISLDPKGLPMDVELQNTRQQVIPRSGSVVRLRYRTSVGRPVLINIGTNGKELPLGAAVRDEKGNTVGTVAQGGTIYARLPVAVSQLNVAWGKGKQERCTFKVSVPKSNNGDKAKVANILSINSKCL